MVSERALPAEWLDRMTAAIPTVRNTPHRRAADRPDCMVPAAVPGSSDLVGAPIAMIDAEGTVVGWTQAAQRLVGYSHAEMVSQPAAVILASAEDWAKASAFAEQCRARGGWSGLAA